MKSSIVRHEFSGRSYLLRLFLLTILPLTLLVLVVSLGSQKLHEDAMHALVADRDLRAVRTSARNIEEAIKHQNAILQILAEGIHEENTNLWLPLKQDKIFSYFNHGLALYAAQGVLLSTLSPTGAPPDWLSSSTIKPVLQELMQSQTGAEPILTTSLNPDKTGETRMLSGIKTANNQFLIAVFSPERLILGSLDSSYLTDETIVLVIEGGQADPPYHTLLSIGEPQEVAHLDEFLKTRDLTQEQNGIAEHKTDSDDYLISYSLIREFGWILAIGESWQDITSPYLRNTQLAPLVMIPILLLAVLTLWYGVRTIVQPLHKLEKQAAKLADGDFKTIQQSVGGAAEIQSLQTALIETASKLEEAQQNLKGYIGAITSSLENEKLKLSRDLHDDAIQSLIALNQRIQLAAMNITGDEKQVFLDLQQMIQQTILNLRRMIRGLRPIYLEDFGLVSALEMLAKETTESSSLPIQVKVSGEPERLNPDIEMSIYRMVQESLNNIVRHAGAGNAWVQLNFKEDCLEITIQDNGSGFDMPPSTAAFAQQGHYGLLGLKERSELIGAKLMIQSYIEQGTTIHIHLPSFPG